MLLENIFSGQTTKGQIPTLMLNRQEGSRKLVDTLAITMVAVYLAQLHQEWKEVWGSSIEQALNFIEQQVYQHEIEGFKMWHFNGFYPPDWEDTSFAVFLLVKNGRISPVELGPLRELLENNTTEEGTGVWIKDTYSADNIQRNHWDPTSALNILRIHYILGSDPKKRILVERFIQQNLLLDEFAKATLYYTAPVAAFFGKRLIEDFPNHTTAIALSIRSFHQEVFQAVRRGYLIATPFEKALLGIITDEKDVGLIFHHGKRFQVWYGSPVLHNLAQSLCLVI